MQVLDLGGLAGPVLAFGGPYSNLHATRALLAQAARLGIGAQNTVCTGDLVAYCAEGAATVAAIRASGCAVVAGNCERQLATGALDCGCGFADGTACDRLSASWYAHADAQIGAADRAWMAALPDVVTFRHDGLRCAALHGGVTDIARFLFTSSPDEEFQHEINALKGEVGPIDRVIAGHSGLCFARTIGAVQWINAGAIGLPPHDGRPQTRFAVLTRGGVVFHRLDYDHAGAAGAMRAAGLTQGYDRALCSGVWPSEEVLPAEMRR